MPPFATTGGISGVELKAASRAARNTALFIKSRNHPKVPETRRPMGRFCALHSADIGSAFSALGGFGPRSLYEIEGWRKADQAVCRTAGADPGPING